MNLRYQHEFPPKNIDLGALAALIGRANASLSRYDGLLESLINPEVMLSPLVMKEAELSSRIEGTIATANEVYQQQAGEKFEPGKDADIQEILNYRSTLRNAERSLGEDPLSLHLLRQMHENLMQGVRGQDKNPGQFRETQNWIGPRGCTIKEATYVPPSPLVLKELLEQFVNFANSLDESLDPIVQAALIHAQFELIHPFDDGNGRIGRMLIPLFLVRRGSIVSPSLYISGYLEANRDEYYQCLENISGKGDWFGWIKFFLNAVVKQSENNLNLVRKVIELYDRKKREISELLHTDQAIYIVDMLFDTPVFRANKLHQRLNIQRQRAAQYIRSLKDAGIIVEIRPSSGRTPALLSFEDLWKITDRQ
ncbi:MAG: cell filamentation protein Fic [SAR86 cluster bacterium]|uniref:Protein adenylyltransferase n=1 Tax=SAR86 cluster bacterium TaxID=2030880 RepID=A0A2A5CIB9_9GAMM|nr:MAG: cell filamentation protein Fic [SAR86 cluster bacterium]